MNITRLQKRQGYGYRNKFKFAEADLNHVPGREEQDFCRRAMDAFFTEPKIWTFQNPISLSRENWIAYIQSQDDSILPGEQGYEEYIAALNEQFDKESVDGKIAYDRLTRIYYE